MLAKNYKGNALRVRPVFMTARMKAVLQEWKLEQPNHPNADSSLVIGYKDVKRAWHTVRKTIGREDLRLHDLRHVFATRLSQNNVPLDNISKLLGHGQINTTQIYLNPSHADLRSSIQTLEEDE
jgi:integrase